MTVIRGDARALPIRPKSVQAVVTSPPYLEQRTYGPSPLEGGHEGNLAGYVTWLVDVLDQLRGPAGALRDDGLLWLNLGDKANGSGGAGGDWTTQERATPREGNRRRGARRSPMQGAARFYDRDFPLASFLDVPGAVVHALLQRGWRLRCAIVWDKGRLAPESLRHANRPGWQHEMIYLLAPSAQRPRFYPSMLTEPGSVWRFPPGGSGPSHLAPFPDELARRCILPSTLPGDLVLDPFDGSGTTRRVAEQLGRRGVGVDLYAQAPAEPPRPAQARHVDAKELAALGLKPALLYYACRRIVAGQDLDTIARDFKITPDQAAYIERITRPEGATA